MVVVARGVVQGRERIVQHTVQGSRTDLAAYSRNVVFVELLLLFIAQSVQADILDAAHAFGVVEGIDIDILARDLAPGGEADDRGVAVGGQAVLERLLAVLEDVLGDFA